MWISKTNFEEMLINFWLSVLCDYVLDVSKMLNIQSI